MPFTEKQIAALDAKLDPKHVVKPTGRFGPKGDYIEGWFAIKEANRIFGFDGWSYETIELVENHEPVPEQGQNRDQFMVSFRARARVTAGGAVREDVGHGSGNSKNLGDAYEGATKEAITDAIKRCLRTFGDPLGLALYDKSRANVGVDEPEPTETEQRMFSDLAKIVQNATSLDMLTAAKDSDDFKRTFKALPTSLKAKLRIVGERQTANLTTPTGEMEDA